MYRYFNRFYILMLISELITVNKKMCIVILQYLTPIKILRAIKPFELILNLSG